MAKARLAFVLSLGLVAAVLSSCTSTPSGSTATVSALPDSAFTLIYSQGREGGIEPCGCHSHPNGGVDRDLNATNAIRKAHPNSLYVESGDLFAPAKLVAKARHYRDRGDLMVKILGELGVQAYGPGPADYALGLAFLKKVEKDAKFKMVSTNVVDKKGASVFPTYQIFDIGGTPVAVLSVIPDKAKLPDGLKVTDAKAALKKTIAEIGTKAKLFIGLVNINELAEERAFALTVPEVNIWVGNDEKNTIPSGEVVGNAILVDSHRFGYYLGQLVVDLKQPVKGFYSEAILKARRDRLAGYEEARKMITEPARIAKLDKKIADYKASAIMEKAEGQSAFDNQVIALDEKTYGTPNVLSEWMKAAREKIRKAALDAPTPTAGR
jgi:2',3'-cyclic-nucleotide 2'-phosphodiesterase (5'-nucleotidase family)